MDRSAAALLTALLFTACGAPEGGYTPPPLDVLLELTTDPLETSRFQALSLPLHGDGNLGDLHVATSGPCLAAAGVPSGGSAVIGVHATAEGPCDVRVSATVDGAAASTRTRIVFDDVADLRDRTLPKLDCPGPRLVTLGESVACDFRSGMHVYRPLVTPEPVDFAAGVLGLWQDRIVACAQTRCELVDASGRSTASVDAPEGDGHWELVLDDTWRLVFVGAGNPRRVTTFDFESGQIVTLADVTLPPTPPEHPVVAAQAWQGEVVVQDDRGLELFSARTGEAVAWVPTSETLRGTAGRFLVLETPTGRRLAASVDELRSGGTVLVGREFEVLPGLPYLGVDVGGGRTLDHALVRYDLRGALPVPDARSLRETVPYGAHVQPLPEGLWQGDSGLLVLARD